MVGRRVARFVGRGVASGMWAIGFEYVGCQGRGGCHRQHASGIEEFREVGAQGVWEPGPVGAPVPGGGARFWFCFGDFGFRFGGGLGNGVFPKKLDRLYILALDILALESFCIRGTP